MFGYTFHHGLIKKYVVLFGTLFNDIYINRVDPTSSDITNIKVPISYSPKDKMLARLDADPNLQRPAIVLPRMGFELTDINYAPTRKLNTLIKHTAIDPDNGDQLKYTYNPVPYDFNFILSIAVKNADDGTKILEQILPFFTPEWTPSVELIPELNINHDIPVVLNAVSSEDSYEGDFETRRAIIWTLSFTLKGYVYGPVRKSNIIKIANTNFYDSTVYDSIDASVGNVDIASSVDVLPGLLANGSPTSNSSLTVSPDQINANDNYGYIITKS